EKGAAFDHRSLEDPQAQAELEALWPLKRFPVLVDGERTLLEASVVIEHVDRVCPGAPLIPAVPEAALEARMLDRVFDNYVMTPMQKIVADQLRPEGERDAFGVNEARGQLDAIYAWLDKRMAGRTWAVGEAFGLADCAAAPSLFYAD